MNSLKKKAIWVSIITFLISILLVPLCSFFYGETLGAIIRNAIFALVFALGLVYIFLYSFFSESFDYDNHEHPYRFLLFYSICLFVSLISPLVDKKTWIFLSIGVILSLYSNAIIGIYASSGMLLFSILLSGNADAVTFFVFFIAMAIGVMLFRDIDENFRVMPYICISSLILFMLELSGFIMLENLDFTIEVFIFPIVGIVVNILALIGALKYFNQFVANRYRDKFLELNDQEYSALIDLKNQSKEEYFRSIHTAYLAERIANAIKCDVNVTKNCAYYHRIKKAFNYSDKDCLEFVEKNEFPPSAAKMLLSFLDKDSKLIAKEAGVVYISDKVISLLMALFANNKDAKIDYDDMITTMFEKNYFKDTLSDSELNQHDFKVIKEILLKETLYYDFLR